jgi:hypothetical protein
VKENTLEVWFLNPNVYITVCALDVTEISVLKQLWMFEVLVFWITPSVFKRILTKEMTVEF